MAQTPWQETFEGRQTSWLRDSANAQYSLVRHQRVQDEAHSGYGSELWKIRGDRGTQVFVSHPAGRAGVIEELSPSVWVKSDRPGIRIAARLILPRTVDPRSGKPVSTILYGSSYSNVGRWAQLRIDDMPRLLARQVRALRAELGPQVDGREAYVQSILLNVYGGPGETSVWIDDLQIAGFVSTGTKATEQRSFSEPSADNQTTPAQAAPTARLVGSLLMLEGRPMFPRIIQHRGEPLGFLKKLGFNAVWLDRIPPRRMLDEAARLGLWIICPPPQVAAAATPMAATPRISSKFDKVLAWDLGRGLSGEHLDDLRNRAQQVRAADGHKGRPLICNADTQLRAYSRQVDLLLIGRRPLGTSLELADYGTWIRRQPLLARPGTPVWTTIQTQPATATTAQLAAMATGSEIPRTVAPEQIRLMVYTAVAAGSRGLLFQSQSPLDTADSQTGRRAMTLELLNIELQLIEPWAAAGTFQATAQGNRPGIGGAILRTDRARLLLPTWVSPGAQCVPGQAGSEDVSLLLPGMPESTAAYEITPGRLHPLRHKRVTGGIRVTFEDFGLGSFVLLSQDPLIINALARRAARVGPRVAQLERRLAEAKLQTVALVAGKLPPRSTASRAGEFLAAARKDLHWCDSHMAAKDYPTASTYARRATRSLRIFQRACWEEAVSALGSPVATPGTVSFEALPLHWQMAERIRASSIGPNLLNGSEMEDLGVMLRGGWRHFERGTRGIETMAELSPLAAKTGRTGLRLSATATDKKNPPGVVEAPPIWITTNAVPIEAGQIACIEGWVKVPRQITGSVDGLMIIDSLTGEALASRIKQTDDWQQLIIYRIAPRSGTLSITFALSGIGEAWLDDISVRILRPAHATVGRPGERR